VILITGTPRSGTSLLMQTLDILGIPKTGDEFSKTNIPENNTKGYWELPLEERRNLSSDYKGKCVKLLSEDLFVLNPEYVEKIIFTTRYMGHCSKSFLKCLKANNNPLLPPKRIVAENLINGSYKIACWFMRVNPEIPRIETTFEKMTKDSEKEIKRICEFLDIEFNQKAVENIGS